MLDKIMIDELREAPLSVDVDVTPESLGLEDETFRFEGNITGKLTFYLVGHDVSGNGRLSATVVAPCVRCLEPASTEFSMSVNEMWFCADPEPDKKSKKAKRRQAKRRSESRYGSRLASGPDAGPGSGITSRKSAQPAGPGDDLEEGETFKGEELDARETLRELIMAELPDLPKCREDCKGLCPRCGANLNTEPCDCKTAQSSDSSPDSSPPSSSDAPAEKSADSPDQPPEPEWKRKMRELRDKM